MVDRCGTQVGDKWKTRRTQVYTHAAQGTQGGREGWETSVETSVNSYGPRYPEWETSGRQVGDNCKLIRPKRPRVGDNCGSQV